MRRSARVVRTVENVKALLEQAIKSQFVGALDGRSNQENDYYDLVLSMSQCAGAREGRSNLVAEGERMKHCVGVSMRRSAGGSFERGEYRRYN